MTAQQSSNLETRTRLSTRNLVFVIAAVAVLVVAVVYISFPPPNTSSPFNSPADNSSSHGGTLPMITFDFDSGSPLLVEGQNTPLIQTSDGVEARFSSPSDLTSPAFSVQSYETTFMVLPRFSGRWLYDNKPSMDVLDIVFSQRLTSINLTFATLEYHGGPSTEPTEIRLTAYRDSTDTTPIGSATARGFFSTGLYPQGTLAFSSGTQTFNVVRIEIPYVPQGASDFFVDNVVVTKAQ